MVVCGCGEPLCWARAAAADATPAGTARWLAAPAFGVGMALAFALAPPPAAAAAAACCSICRWFWSCWFSLPASAPACGAEAGAEALGWREDMGPCGLGVPGESARIRQPLAWLAVWAGARRAARRGPAAARAVAREQTKPVKSLLAWPCNKK